MGVDFCKMTLSKLCVRDLCWSLVAAEHAQAPYRGTSLITNNAPLGPYSRNMPRALCWSKGGGLFPMSKVPPYQLSLME